MGTQEGNKKIHTYYLFLKEKKSSPTHKIMAIVSGSYKLKENHNLTSILEAQGVGKIERTIADQIHNNQIITITYDTEEKTINQKNTFVKNPNQTNNKNNDNYITNVVEYTIDAPPRIKNKESCWSMSFGCNGRTHDSVVLNDDGFVLKREECDNGSFVVTDTYIFNNELGLLDIIIKCITKDGKVVEAKRHFVRES